MLLSKNRNDLFLLRSTGTIRGNKIAAPYKTIITARLP